VNLFSVTEGNSPAVTLSEENKNLPERIGEQRKAEKWIYIFRRCVEHILYARLPRRRKTFLQNSKCKFLRSLLQRSHFTNTFKEV
jgi:hypothetical protein